MDDGKTKRVPAFSDDGWPIFGGYPRDPEECDFSDEQDRYFYRENISINGSYEDCDILWQDLAPAPSR